MGAHRPLLNYTPQLIPLPSVRFLLGEHFPPLRSKGIRLVQKHYAQRYTNPDAQGDTFVIDVSNQLHDTSMDVATSIVSISCLGLFGVIYIPVQHWHGIRQHTFNAYDGASFVTQCPIIPGDVFRYQFTVPSQTVRYGRTVAS